MVGAPQATHVAKSEMQFWCRVATAAPPAAPSTPCEKYATHTSEICHIYESAICHIYDRHPLHQVLERV